MWPRRRDGGEAATSQGMTTATKVGEAKNSMMANSVGQLIYATGRPDMQTNSIFSAPVRVLLDEINTQIGILSRVGFSF